MRVIYIDTNEATAVQFRQIMQRHAEIECLAISESRKAILHLMDAGTSPQTIIIHCGVKDISCKSFIEFVRTREQLTQTEVIVVGDYFSSKEIRQYKLLGASRCEVVKFDAQGITGFLESNIMHL